MIRAALAAAALAAAAVPAEATERAELISLQADDLRLQTIGWRLARGNARFCDRAVGSIGLLLADARAFARPQDIRAALGLRGDIAVQAAVPGSPAALAGLTANDTIAAIDGRPMDALPAVKAGGWQRLAGLHDAIDAALAKDGAVRIDWLSPTGPRSANITGVPVCPTRFELLSGGTRAAADGTRVVIGREFAGMRYAEDELAAALAHELAHNLLAHRAWLRGVGRKQANIRVTEREADRMMPWLLANAGYPPEAAARFFERWGPLRDGWIFRGRSHDGWDERAGFVRGELPLIETARAASGSADWRPAFRRDTKH